MMAYFKIAALFVLTGLLITIQTVSAVDSHERVIIVLDASGSMWGQIDGTPKIQIAREVIADLMADWDPGIELGLMAYGHRRKGDCSDIEMLIPVGIGNGDRITKAVNAINPKGKTPLSEAVKRAAQELRFSEERATVVLVSDGVETCDADPCAIGAELAMTGADFTAHVVGFDVTGVDQEGLRCLAENTGGEFLAAANAAELKTALQSAVKKVQETPRQVVEDPGEATVQAPSEVPAGQVFDVTWTGPDSHKDYITIVRVNAPAGTYMDYSYSKDGSPATLTAPGKIGDYEVRYVHGVSNKTLAAVPLKVTPVTATVTCMAEITVGGFISVEWTGPGYQGDYITIVAPDAPPSAYLGYANATSGNPVSFQVPGEIGQYEIRYVMNLSRTVLATAPITVTAVTATVNVEDPVAAGAFFQVTWTGPDNKGDYLTIVSPDASDGEYGSYVSTSSGSPGKLRATDTPGEYEVRYILNQTRTVLARTRITTTPVTAQVQVEGPIETGKDFMVVWNGPTYPSDYITIVPKGAKDGDYLSYAYLGNGSPSKLRAPDKPGDYEIRYILNQSKTVLARVAVTVQ